MHLDKEPQQATNHLTALEEQMLAGLTVDNLVTLQRLTLPFGDLSEGVFLTGKEEIIGVRSEDLLFLIDCIKKGHVPVSVGDLRFKNDKNGLYVSPNSASPALRQKQHLDFKYEQDLDAVIEHNSGLYGDIAVVQAFYRNIFSHITNQEAFIREYYREFGMRASGNDAVKVGCSFNVVKEEFFDDVAGFIKEEIPLLGPLNKPDFFKFLCAHLKHVFTPAQLQTLLKSFESRGGIVIGFNRKMLEYDVRISEEAGDVDEEIVFDIPDGRLPLGTIAGFEARGNFEADLLKRLGIV